MANNAGYTGDLEIALVTEQFRHEILGEVYDTDGNLVENSGSPISEFALMFEFDGDKNHIRYCFYRCTASRPNTEGSTIEDEKEVQTETLSLTISALDDGTVRKKTGEKTSAEAYNSWYKAVTFPTIEIEAPTAYPAGNSTIKMATSASSSSYDITSGSQYTSDYTSIVLTTGTPNAKIMYRIADASSTSTNPTYTEYTKPFKIAAGANVNNVNVITYAVTTDESGTETKSTQRTFHYTPDTSSSSSSAKAGALVEDEE